MNNEKALEARNRIKQHVIVDFQDGYDYNQLENDLSALLSPFDEAIKIVEALKADLWKTYSAQAYQIGAIKALEDALSALKARLPK